MDKTEVDYLRGGSKPLTTDSSVLISSSKYLNSSAMRHITSQEMLRKYGSDLTPAYFIPEINAAFQELQDYPAVLQLFANERAAKPEFAAWLDNRFLSTFIPDELAQYRRGTLGAMVHDFITVSGFDIDFMFRGAPNDDYQYWLKRFIQSHDIQHMATGFDVTPIGEYALIVLNTTNYLDYFAPELAAELSRQTTFALASGLMRSSLHYPQTLSLMFDAIEQGRAMARALKKPLFYVRWEDYLGNTIAEIREDLNIVGAPREGAWTWAYELMK